MRKTITLFLFLLTVGNCLFAQYENAVTIPRVSQQAEMSQTIGLTKITVSYSRPLVKGREIFGKLIQYGNIWRAGADENTVLSLSSDVTINNQIVKAGSYGLHIIPNENEWTVILNTEIDAWGSYFYDKSKDVLRFKVTPQKTAHREALSFNFVNINKDGVDLQLAWADTVISFPITVNTPMVTVQNIRKELKSRLAFGSNGYLTAAQYCLNNDINLEEALGWVDRSSRRGVTFTSLNLKADILKKLGKTEESETFSKQALEIATDQDLTNYAFSKIRANDNKAAIQVLNRLVKKSPKNFNAYSYLGFVHSNLGDKKSALSAYKKALKLAPKDQKSRIQQRIDAL